MAGSVLLSACSEYIQEIPTPTSTITVSPTSTKTLTPTATHTPTATPTPKPQPFEVRYTVEGAGNIILNLPFTTIEDRPWLGEVVDFSDWENLPWLPDISHLPQWHETLRKVIKNNGELLVQPFPADVEKATWEFMFPDKLGESQGLRMIFAHVPYERQPFRTLAGFRIPYPMIDPDYYNMWLVGITAQICNPFDHRQGILVMGLGNAIQLQNGDH